MADKNIERLQDDVSRLQRQAAAADTVVARLDVTLDKIAELSQSVESMLLVHERRFEELKSNMKHYQGKWIKDLKQLIKR